MNSKDIFLNEYSQQLTKAVTEHPNEYAYPPSECEFVYARMAAAIERGSYNKNSRAFKATCKVLGIPHTYKAINAFINEEVSQQ